MLLTVVVIASYTQGMGVGTGTNRLLGIRLHRDHRQALRVRRALLGVVAYLMWISVGIYLHVMGLMRVELGWLLSYILLTLITNVVFLVIIRLDWNLRFRDPGMTLVQIGFGIFWGMVLLYQAEPVARGGMLLIFVTGFFFGVFRLTTRQFLGLTLFASLAYASLLRLDWNLMDADTRQTEIAQWLFLTVVLIWMSFMGGYVARLRANLRSALSRIEELAHRDHLTGTGNRRAITGTLESALQACVEHGGALAVALLDLDRFKALNDKLGHLSGDAVLREFVQRIEHELRGEDFIQGAPAEQLGRFGGEEFLVVLPGSNLAGGRAAAERLREAIACSPFTTEAGEVPVTVSIGVAEYRQGDSPEDILRRADRALYRAKEAGRNRVEVN
ncbi:GGDEF domain-containing protein [Natronospira bacteriovora]|uniref:diguanylate cyclase n=1 Tax=Natronospira bacteriovora TaxID=3069753 RepID=A0ABU0W6W5_9GAMM|nr:GGDEF domain-containing protein [Natronospira sp. AB-CW4]MDQ2069751.1 GGDEF domain-containing protein [Natronospira sp. AB-CW4]